MDLFEHLYCYLKLIPYLNTLVLYIEQLLINMYNFMLRILFYMKYVQIHCRTTYESENLFPLILVEQCCFLFIWSGKRVLTGNYGINCVQKTLTCFNTRRVNKPLAMFLKCLLTYICYKLQLKLFIFDIKNYR